MMIVEEGNDGQQRVLTLDGTACCSSYVIVEEDLALEDALEL